MYGQCGHGPWGLAESAFFETTPKHAGLTRAADDVVAGCGLHGLTDSLVGVDVVGVGPPDAVTDVTSVGWGGYRVYGVDSLAG